MPFAESLVMSELGQWQAWQVISMRKDSVCVLMFEPLGDLYSMNDENRIFLGHFLPIQPWSNLQALVVYDSQLYKRK